jgi:hypothetical protein
MMARLNGMSSSKSVRERSIIPTFPLLSGIQNEQLAIALTAESKTITDETQRSKDGVD